MHESKKGQHPKSISASTTQVVIQDNQIELIEA